MPSCYGEKRGGTYRAVWREGDRRRTKSFGKFKDARDTFIQNKLRELYAIEAGAEPDSLLTFGDLAKRYLEHSQKHKAARTYAHFDKPTIDAAVTAFGGEVSIPSITQEKISLWETELLKEYKASTVSMKLRVLRTALNFAKRNGWIKATPHVYLPQVDEDVGRVIQNGELARIIKACRPEIARATKILVHHGMRVGELFALQWEDVKEDGLHIKTLKRRQGASQRFRVVPLHPATASQMRPKGRSGPVMGDLTLNAFKAAFSKVVRGLKLPRTRVHDLRHTWATEYMIQNGNLSGLMRYGGWMDFKSVDKYQHLTKGHSEGFKKTDFGL